MIFAEPVPFREALEYTQVQSLLPTVMRSWEIQELEAAIRQRAFFSSGVANAEFLQEALTLVETLVEGDIDRATARNRLREFVKQGDPPALITNQRLNLILDTNVAQAAGYGRWKSLETEFLVERYPVRELYRAMSRQQPRPWLRKWANAGGRTYGGRMLALKDARIWTLPLKSGGFNRFGTPYPPFDFNSGMRTRPIKREEAVRLGVIQAYTPAPAPAQRGLNDELSASPEIRSESLKQAIVKNGVGTFDAEGTLYPN